MEKFEKYLNEGTEKVQLKVALTQAHKYLTQANSIIKKMETGEKFKDEMSDILNQVSQFKARF